jgi:citrate lyase beta subunit
MLTDPRRSRAAIWNSRNSDGPDWPFHLAPEQGDGADRKSTAFDLGATLYVPALRNGLAQLVAQRASDGVRSVILCLEDSIADGCDEEAEASLMQALCELEALGRPMPHVFVRPRSHSQLVRILERAPAGSCRGVVIPKFTLERGSEWLSAIQDYALLAGGSFWAMPILETRDLVAPSRRSSWLRDCADLLDERQDVVCGVRVGTSDISGHLGLRRDDRTTVYGLAPIAAVLSDAIAELYGHPGVPALFGGVWEYIPDVGRGLSSMGAFSREVQMDIAHGFKGKSIIHPSQAAVVMACLAVSFADWVDASAVLQGDGASRSSVAPRMNEAKPHRLWATETLLRARHWGVVREGADWTHVHAWWAGQGSVGSR